MKGAFEYVFETIASFFVVMFLVVCLFNGIVEQQAESLLQLATGTVEHYERIDNEIQSMILQQNPCPSCQLMLAYYDHPVYNIKVEVIYPFRLITIVKTRRLVGYVKKETE